MSEPRIDRRRLLALIAVAGAAPAVRAAEPALSEADIAACERFAGMRFTGAERTQMLAAVDDELDRLRGLRDVTFENDLPPAETFDPRLPGWEARPLPAPAADEPAPPLPTSAEDIAFAPAVHQAAWIAAGSLGARELTDLYLDRIERRAPRLSCFVTVLADEARAEADERDRERARGALRGPLHGLPYGLKDLIDTAGIRTTWGAEPYRDRIAETDATVVRRLREAGAVLIGKTTLGALAYGDIWFAGRTRNPWNPEEGSSGSSAGSAAAVADGLCSFGIGTETMGSIVSPAARCGTVGLRPTFGRVGRSGAMALCWSYDKIGVLSRAAADAAAVMRTINGPDPGDPSSLAMPLAPLPAIEPRGVRIGYRPEWFDGAPPHDRAALSAARDIGFELVEIAMPDAPVDLLGGLVVTESAAAFERLTLDDVDDSLRWQDDVAWPNSWRAARFEPAIGYIQAQRLRRRLMRQFAEAISGVDAILHPNGAGDLLAIGNHCGYPALVLPTGMLEQPTREGFTTYVAPEDVPAGAPLHRVPFTTTLTGRLFDEPRLIAIGRLLEARVRPEGLRPPG